MPTVPKFTNCAFFQCKAAKTKDSPYCIEHGGKPDIAQDRAVFNAMYKSKYWLSMRAAQLSRYPLCASCMARGIVAQAAHVDHVFPWARLGDHAFRHNLFQSLCGPCHSVKTAREKSGIFLYFTNTNTIEYKITDYPAAIANSGQ